MLRYYFNYFNRGDIQPFTQIGKKLQADGHRVRIATHSCFRDYVCAMGLEFFPLAGDPHKLSEFMVRNHGNIIPSLSDLVHEVPQNLKMLSEIIHSCWGACVHIDPMDNKSKPFIADAIISNPVTYGHIHCAEALGIPLQLMFPQPWLPTKAFPHPMSCLSYQNSWSTENYISYQMVDQMFWLSMRGAINLFREKTLGLQPIGPGDNGWNLLNSNKVPFVKMWSPILVPKPKDWPDYVDIVGTFAEDDIPIPILIQNNIDDIEHTSKPSFSSTFVPNTELATFLSSSTIKPIFLGFGSMIIDDPESLIRDFLDAAALANVRILIQTGWSEITQGKFEMLALQAEQKAKVVRETEDRNNRSIIFPRNENFAENQKQISNNYVPNNKIEITTRGELDDLFGQVDINPYLDQNNETSQKLSFLNEADYIDEEDYVTISSDDDAYNNLIDSNAFTGDLSTDFDTKPTSIIPIIIENSVNVVGEWIAGSAGKLSSRIGSFYSQSTNQKVPIKIMSENDDFSNSNRLLSIPTIDDVKKEPEWEEIIENNNNWKASRDAILIGPCPHSWLFQHVGAVIHHGGSGTTAASLRAGLPTWICPFFGDQHFWGEMVSRHELGPKPCPIEELTLSRIVDSMHILLNDKIKEKSLKLSKLFQLEDGASNSVKSFYNHLPLDSMLCDASIFLGESRLAQVYCQECDMKLCHEVSERIHHKNSSYCNHHIYPCRYIDWSVQEPSTPTDGLIQGLTGFVNEVTDGMSEVIYQPVKGIYQDGLQGGATGLAHGIVNGIVKPFYGGSVLINKVRKGFQKNLNINMNEPNKHNNVDDDMNIMMSSNSFASDVLKRRANSHSYDSFDEIVDKQPNNKQEIISPKEQIISTLNSITEEESVVNESLLELVDPTIESTNTQLIEEKSLLIKKENNLLEKSESESESDNDLEENVSPFLIMNNILTSEQTISNQSFEENSIPIMKEFQAIETIIKTKIDSIIEMKLETIIETNSEQTNDLNYQKLWEEREKEIWNGYNNAKHIRAIMYEITNNNSRILSLNDFTKLVERALSRQDIISTINMSKSSWNISINNETNDISDDSNYQYDQKDLIESFQTYEENENIQDKLKYQRDKQFLARSIVEVCNYH